MQKEKNITVWDGCNPTIAEAIQEFERRWKPHSIASRGYSIMRLLREVIDPAVTGYIATLPECHLGFASGVGNGMSFSEIAELIGFDTLVRSQRLLLRQFVKTEDKQDAVDKCFVATFESLIGLAWDCASKQPVKQILRNTKGEALGLNGRRPKKFCRFCGAPTSLKSFAGDNNSSRGRDDKLRFSHLYCASHQPKLQNGSWNPAYKKATRSIAQFDLELGRLSRQCAKRTTPHAASGDPLVDDYFYLYFLGQTIQPADKTELRDLARLMVDARLTDRKKQILALQKQGLNQSEIAKKLGVNNRQSISKALSTIPKTFYLP
ncbi:LuxR family transcriptional regulator [Providencia rettgeri]|nr:LuxR family transcriptional regulator [Providencia rettgeri]